MKPRLFVISPIGPENSETRQKANLILAMVKEAVGDLYDVVRHDEQTRDASINRGLQKSLDTAMMAVAYLGRPEWNANVMFETGYRIATRKPVLVVSHEGDKLPFDLQDIRQVRLPDWSELEKYQPRREKMKELCSNLEILRHPAIESAYPVVEIMIDLTPDQSDEETQRNCVFTMSSHAADHLFHSKATLAGQGIVDVAHKLERLMDENQWHYFDREQDQLLGKLLKGNTDINAYIPFIFKDDEAVHPDLRGVAYLAMIVQHRRQENALLLRVLYYRVPSTLLKAEDGDYHWCNPDALPHLTEAIREIQKIPAAPIKGAGLKKPGQRKGEKVVPGRRQIARQVSRASGAKGGSTSVLNKPNVRTNPKFRYRPRKAK